MDIWFKNIIHAQLSPFPSNGQFEVLTTSGIYGGQVAWELIDVAGKLQRTGQLQAVNGAELKIPFDLADLKAGVYTLRLTAGGKTSVKRVAVR